MILISGAILMATQLLPTFRSMYDLNPGVQYLVLTFPLGILMHTLTRTLHLGRVLPRMVVSISHGRRMNSSTNAERHFRRTPFPMCSTWIFPDICIRTEASSERATCPLRPNRRHNAYVMIYAMSPLTSQCARQLYHFPLPLPTARYDHS
jgi:hypothetical protein